MNATVKPNLFLVGHVLLLHRLLCFLKYHTAQLKLQDNINRIVRHINEVHTPALHKA